MNIKYQKEERTPLNKVILEINKIYGDKTLTYANKLGIINRIPTGIKIIDECLGGGFPKGRISELYGIPASGKSLLCLLTIKSAQSLNLSCVWINAEHSFDPTFAGLLGIDMKTLAILDLSIGEDVIDIIAKLLPAKPGLIIIDSVASLVPNTDMEKSMKENTMATRARLMSRGLAKINALNQNTCLIFINQVRDIVTTWGRGGTTTPGGRALPHYASLRLEVKAGDKLTGKNKDDVIGQIIQVRVVKNKSGQPYKRGSFKFFYDSLQIE